MLQIVTNRELYSVPGRTMIGILGSAWTPRCLSWSFQIPIGPSRYSIESAICDNMKHQKRCLEVRFFLACSISYNVMILMLCLLFCTHSHFQSCSMAAIGLEPGPEFSSSECLPQSYGPRLGLPSFAWENKKHEHDARKALAITAGVWGPLKALKKPMV